ncbi:putative sulfate transporter [Patescibacteria group bacterium]|nr:putative sulfate transporter [Patescibacteria group bacterium]
MFNTNTLSRYFPIIEWLKTYHSQNLTDDVFAGIITAIMLVPQGIAYAILAGLPPQLGLYASILPPAIYAVFGTSRILSVGPVSIASIMIASALNAPAIKALGDSVPSALILSLECGVVMLVMAMLRMGSLVNFISHPVLTGFTSGASLLIIGNQLPLTLGLKAPLCAWDVACYQTYLQGFNPITLILSIAALCVLLTFNKPLPILLKKLGMKSAIATAISKCGALLTVVLVTVVVTLLADKSVVVIGSVPSGLPVLNLDSVINNLDERGKVLLPYATLISLISYIESVAIAKMIANLRGEKIEPNQELVGLSLANMAACVSGGMPVAGGLSRTMVNLAAGARTQLAMLIAAVLLSFAVVFCSPWFTNIPKAVLAVIILVAIMPLVKLKTIWHTWQYDKGDGIAELITLLGVLVLGLEEGLTLGIALTIASQLRKASHPHIAIVGRVPDTEHYRNIKRHQVETWQHLLLIRIDESITFANVNYIEEFLLTELKRHPAVKHVILIFTSVSDIDSTALEALESLNQLLKTSGKTLNIAEAKGPVMDKLQKTDFFEQLKPGLAFFRTEDAVKHFVM